MEKSSLTSSGTDFLREKKKRKFYIWIGIIFALSPVWGGLASAIQMIGTFKKITIYGTGDSTELSAGISSALTTTEIGILFFPLGLGFLIWAISSYKRFTRTEMSQQVGELNTERLRPPS